MTLEKFLTVFLFVIGFIMIISVISFSIHFFNYIPPRVESLPTFQHDKAKCQSLSFENCLCSYNMKYGDMFSEVKNGN